MNVAKFPDIIKTEEKEEDMDGEEVTGKYSMQEPDWQRCCY